MFILLFLKRLLKIFGTLCAALFIFALYLLFTPHGSQLLISLVSNITPYKIEYRHFSGYLARQAHFEGFSLTGPRLQLEASTVTARWIMTDLLRPTKTLQFLEAEGLTLHYQGNQVSSHMMQSFLPFPFVIENLHLKNTYFEVGEDRHYIESLLVQRAASADLNSIEAIHYKGSLGTLDMALNESIQAQWNLQFHDIPSPFKPYLQGKLSTQGSILLPKRRWRDPNNKITISMTGQRAHFEHYALEDFTLTLEGTLAKHAITLQGTTNDLPFSSRIQGKLSPSQWQGQIGSLLIDHPLYQALGESSGKIGVDWSQKIIAIQLAWLLGNNHLQGELNIKKSAPHRLNGKIQCNIQHLKQVSMFFPELRRLRGRATANVTLSGSLKKIRYAGDIHFQDLKITTPYLKTKAIIKDLILTLSEKRAMTLSGDGTFGQGAFSLRGTGTLDQRDPFLQIHMQGHDLLLSDTPEYYIVANPDLTLTLRRHAHPTLSGNIVIPHAQIKSLKSPHVIAPSEDVVILTPSKTQDSPPVQQYAFANQLNTHINIILGDRITYEGYGVTTQAAGQISIKQGPGQPTKAKGKITLLKGKYRAYGKRFTLSQGELLFTGGVIDNPTLNIRAERKIRLDPSVKSLHATSHITAGVKFVGPLKSARIELYSSPTLSNADIISYLVIGQPQSQMSESQAAILFEALSQLSIFSGNKRSDVQMSLAEQLKLDQLGFSKKPGSLSTSTSIKDGFQDTVFVLGKQLSDRLYLHYSVGLLGADNNIGLRYFIGDNITLEASTGTDGTSADLLFAFES